MAWKMFDAIVDGTIKLKTKTIDVANGLLTFDGVTVALINDASKSNIATYSSDKVENLVLETYSSVETTVNKSWFGKPVYRRVINAGALLGAVDNSIQMFDHGVVGIEHVVMVDFSAKVAGAPIWLTSAYSYILEDPAGEFQQIRAYVDGSNIAIRTSADLDECFLIMEYTKV